jgi:hypothetical protein
MSSKKLSRKSRARLLRLREIMMRTPPPTKPLKVKGGERVFDMDVWFAFEVVDKPTYRPAKNGECQIEEGFCRTSACALGHAALDPRFQRAGLRIREDDVLAYDVVYKPKGARQVYSGLLAAQRFFGISAEQAKYLFLPTAYRERSEITPRDVVRHIDDVLDQL